MRPINALTKDILREMEARGYSKRTVANRRDRFKYIERWFYNKNGGELTRPAVDDYLATLSARLESGSIGKKHYNELSGFVKYLYEYAETGVIRPFFNPGRRRTFQPGSESIDIIENALSATGLTDRHKYRLHGIMRKFFCFIETQCPCENITKDVIVSFIHHCRGASMGHMRHIVRSLKILAEYLVSVGKMPSKPDFRFIVPRPNPRRVIPAYSEQELAAVLAAIDRTKPIGKRDYAIILLAIGTGLRASDIVNLKLADIDWKLQSICIIQGKTCKSLKIPISGQICNAVSDYILNGRPEGLDCNNVFLRGYAPFAPLFAGSLGESFNKDLLQGRSGEKAQQTLPRFTPHIRNVACG